MIAEAAAEAKAGRFGRSLALLAGRLAEKPDDRNLLYARALTLLDWGRLREALADLRAAEVRGLSSLGLCLNVAHACQLLGFAEAAEKYARAAIALDENNPDGHGCLAAVLQTANRFDEAIISYERAYALAPTRHDCLAQIAACKVDQKDGVAAEGAARKAIVDAQHARPWMLLGMALANQDRYDEALSTFEHAEALDLQSGEDTETFFRHGYSLLKCCRLDEAISLYEKHLPLKPHPSAHANYAFSLLWAGRYLEGWQQFEFRWLDPFMTPHRRVFGRPRWNGQDLDGKTVVLWSEQGRGDTIQFARFGRVLKERGARVLFWVPSNLKEFAAGFIGIDRIISGAEEIDEPFDYHIPAMSMPHALRTTVDSIPQGIPYLKADPDRMARWRDRIGADGKLRVGVVWAGNPGHDNDRHRSLPASLLEPLWEIPGVQFFSLQKERRVGDEARVPLGTKVLDWGPYLRDFCETTAAVETLDLVIAVDTAVAHIAGALGKPCWLLLPANSDFRWLREREDTPWYPAMRLFRQQRLGEWAEVVDRVSSALQEAVRSRNDTTKALLRPVPKSRIAPHEEDGGAASILSRVAETRYGILQYSPCQKTLAQSLDWYGEWLERQLDFLAALFRPGAVVIEAASGIGAHAVALARLLGSAGHLLSYEADPVLLRMLHQNLQINTLRTQVTVMPRKLVGLTPSVTRELEANAETSVPAHINDESAMADTIDDLGLSRLDLLKVNDSNAVRRILEGAAETLWRLRPALFLAVSDVAGPGDSARLARDFGYRCWQLKTPLFNPRNFNRRDADLFDGRAKLALVAIPEEREPGAPLDGCVDIA